MELLLKEDHLKYYNQDIIAKSGVSALYDILYSSNEEIMGKIFDTKKVLLEKHPTNIVLKNALSYFLYQLEQPDLKKAAKERHTETLRKITEANSELARLGAGKIRPGSTVFVHSINNNLFDILLEAAKSKRFSVSMLEHSPFSFGKHLSAKLKQKDISTSLFPDIAVSQALSRSDTCLIGADAIFNKGAIAKTGSNVCSAIAKRNNIPVYVCGHSLKYDHERSFLNVIDHQYDHEEHDYRKAYEILEKGDIYAFISDLGIFKPEHIAEEVRFHNSWMFI